MKNNENGITLVSLIVTIIIMMILTTIIIYMGTDNLENSKMTKFVSYMQMIQTKVNMASVYENYMEYGDDLNGTQKQMLQNIIQSEELLTTTDSTYLRAFDSSKIASELEIDNINDEIIIDFKTREVISLKGIEYEGKMYYTQYNLPSGQKLNHKTQQVTRNVEFGDVITNIDGLKATFTIRNIGLTNGTLSYGRMDTSDAIKWTTITNYTTKGESVTTKNITESGTYYFKLVDNATGKDNGVKQADETITYPLVELKLTNSPKLEGALTDLTPTYNYSNLNDSTKWAFATDTTNSANLKYYVWIPKYAYRTDSNGAIVKDENGKVILEFLKGTSDVTSSGRYISTKQEDNGNRWTIPEVFTENGVQKTGVWVHVSSPNQTRNRYN